MLRDIEDNYNLKIVDLDQEDFRQAREFMMKERLLSNDALQLATMSRLGIKDLATDDPDFEAIENITIWKPVSKAE